MSNRIRNTFALLKSNSKYTKKNKTATFSLLTLHTILFVKTKCIFCFKCHITFQPVALVLSKKNWTGRLEQGVATITSYVFLLSFLIDFGYIKCWCWHFCLFDWSASWTGCLDWMPSAKMPKHWQLLSYCDKLHRFYSRNTTQRLYWFSLKWSQTLDISVIFSSLSLLLAPHNFLSPPPFCNPHHQIMSSSGHLSTV